MSLKTLVLLSFYTAIALTIFLVEATIPLPLFFPGIKLGLSNIVTLVALLFLGAKPAGVMLAARILLGAFLVGAPSTLLFSLLGGLCAFLTMAEFLRFAPKMPVWVVSIFGAIAHNAGQLLAAFFYLQTSALIFTYAPILLAAAIITGAFTGLCATRLIPYRSWLAPGSGDR